VTRLDEILSHRVAASSRRTVDSAVSQCSEDDERDAAAEAAEPAHVGLARRLAEAAANSPPVRAVTRLMSRSSSADQ
jgi:hypothetical protein